MIEAADEDSVLGFGEFSGFCIGRAVAARIGSGMIPLFHKAADADRAAREPFGNFMLNNCLPGRFVVAFVAVEGGKNFFTGKKETKWKVPEKNIVNVDKIGCSNEIKMFKEPIPNEPLFLFLTHSRDRDAVDFDSLDSFFLFQFFVVLLGDDGKAVVFFEDLGNFLHVLLYPTDVGTVEAGEEENIHFLARITITLGFHLFFKRVFARNFFI